MAWRDGAVRMRHVAWHSHLQCELLVLQYGLVPHVLVYSFFVLVCVAMDTLVLACCGTETC
jgi:hypothetical protein